MTKGITRRGVGITLGAALAAPPRIALAKDKLTVVMSSFDLLFWGTLTAQELGFFGQQDLEVELVRAGGGARSLATVAGGDAHFNIGAPSSAFRARARGSDVTLIAPAIAQYTDNVTMSEAWARRNNLTPNSSLEEKLRALRGMTLAVSSVGGGADQLLRFLCKQAGLNPDRDLTMTAIPEGAGMLAAMSRGRIDGFVIPPPTGDDAIRNHGARPMFTPGRGEIPALNGFVYIGVIARESWLRRNREVAIRFLRAHQAALDVIHDPARTNTARDAIWNRYQQRTEKALFDSIWENAAPSYPQNVSLESSMIDRIVAFVNETQAEPLDRRGAEAAWTNEYAAQALARPA
ncbi:ABC transporter substrate-binding protein [Muricoccus radiodurans]|uniref:ABC transporter substrate-binding protein n=1 Tax=Muricoccus radiodurans TaxID=2231721 RepID=UPI003CFAC6E4